LQPPTTQLQILERVEELEEVELQQDQQHYQELELTLHREHPMEILP
jgi:hypothetical protein